MAKDERCRLEALTLARAGYDVTVVCPADPAGEEPVSETEHLRVCSYPPPHQPRGFWGHVWELAYCWTRTAVLAYSMDRRQRFDVVHACNPPDTFFLLAAICKLRRRKSVFAQHDLVPELWYSRFRETGWRSGLVHRALLAMERASHRLADAVLVPNESYKRIAVARGGIPPSRVHVVRNGPDLAKVMLVEPDPALREGCGYMVCYLGIMNPQDGLDYLLRAVAHLVHTRGRRDIRFVMLGSGDMDEDLAGLARQLGIEEWVTFAGWVGEPERLSRYLCTADVCVAPDPKTPLNEVSSFMKIMDYMAAAKPIVAFDLDETRVSAGGAAVYARPDDVEDFAERIAELLEDPERRGLMGRKGRERVESALSWAHQEPLLLDVYRDLVPAALPQSLEAVPPESADAPSAAAIAIDSPEGKREFLDFWRIPCVEKGEPAAVSLVTAASLADRPCNAVIILPGEGPADLLTTPDGMAVFAAVYPIPEPPRGLEVVMPLADRRGRVVSHVLHDRAARSFVVPFSLDDAFRGLLTERYANRRRFPSAHMLNLYYRLKPMLPRPLVARSRRFLAPLQARASFPRWPLDDSLERLRRLVLELLLRASVAGELPFVWFWPNGRESCLVLTHDVESGLTDNAGVWRIIGAEESAGVRSAFNVVPFKYDVPQEELARLRDHGCEVGVHGYDHDGDMFASHRRFAEAGRAINRVRRQWGATGFRSSSTFRDPALITQLDFDYDCSFFDTDPFEPQPGGCLSLFPYFLGELVEIPMTLPQDITLFTIKGEHDGRVWREKLSAIRELNAMVCLDVHPDAGYIGDPDKLPYYEQFLAEAVGERIWNPLPGELAQWWRARRSAAITVNGRGPEITGGTSEMEVRWARLEDGRVVFEKSSAGSSSDGRTA